MEAGCLLPLPVPKIRRAGADWGSPKSSLGTLELIKILLLCIYSFGNDQYLVLHFI